jgi:hypothetical protein
MVNDRLPGVFTPFIGCQVAHPYSFDLIVDGFGCKFTQKKPPDKIEWLFFCFRLLSLLI